MSTSPQQILSPYQNQIHRLGKASSVIAAAAMLMVPVVMTISTDISIDIGATVQAFLGIGLLFIVLTAVEFTSYAPILGAGATYISFITGNTLGLKLPAAMSSVALANVETNSEEAEVVSTMAVAVSSIVTVLIIIIGMIGLSFILPVLQSPQLKPAFDNLMPALIGALAAPYFIGDPKTASLPCAIAAIATLGLGYTVFSQLQALSIPVFILITVGWRYFLYRREQKTNSESTVTVA